MFIEKTIIIKYLYQIVLFFSYKNIKKDLHFVFSSFMQIIYKFDVYYLKNDSFKKKWKAYAFHLFL